MPNVTYFFENTEYAGKFPLQVKTGYRRQMEMIELARLVDIVKKG